MAEEKNRSFYDRLWSQTRITRPESFNTWPLLSSLIPSAPSRVEIGPGLRPRLPIAGTHFIDISNTVIQRLNDLGAFAELGDATALPYPDASMDLVCAFDVIEHVDDHAAAFRQISRVLKDDGILVLSVPLHRRLWTPFDDFVGHARRYEPDDLAAMLQSHHLVAEQSALFGMQPSNTTLLDCGVWFLTHQRSAALFWYNWLFLPLCILLQRPLKFAPGLVIEGASEIVIVCRLTEAPHHSGSAPRSLDRKRAPFDLTPTH